MSGVFSIASHASLQYLPFVTMHEQIGCPHFCPLAVIFFLLGLNSVCQRTYPSRGEEAALCN
jgi:hypothetical protein